MKKLIDARLITFYCLLSVIIGRATPFESQSYVATVVEHSPVMLTQPASRETAQSVMMQNLALYEENIAKAVSEHGSQIIVFPEDGLYGAFFPSRDWALPYLEQLPPDSALPLSICNTSTFATDSPVLNKASCLALQYEIYLVLVMGEVQACTPGQASSVSSDPCPSDGHYQFNTQVAFDPSGRLLAKYHKTNLYFEPEWNTGNGLPVSFSTSFGVRFGMMICFDIMRNDPQQALLADPQVTDLVFSSWWVNNAPQITSTQQQQAWARINGRNMLASGIGRGWYNSGSGIYTAGGHILQSFYNPTNKYASRMLTATVPIIASAPAILAPQPPPQQSYPNPTLTNTLFVPANGSGSFQVKAGDLVCELNFTDAEFHGQTFGLVAQYGLYNEIFNASICSLNRCLQPNDCLSWVTSGAAQFKSLSLTAFLKAQEFDFVLPMFNSDQAQLFPNDVYEQSQLVVEESQTTLKVAPNGLPLLNIALFAVRP